MSDAGVLEKRLEETSISPMVGTVGYDFISLRRKSKSIGEINEGISEGFRYWYLLESQGGREIAKRIGEIYTDEIVRIFFESDIKRFNLQKINVIESKISKITREVKTVLKEDELLIDIIDRIVDRVKNILVATNQKYKIKMSLSRDMEVPLWEEVVLSIGVEEENFDTIIELWDKIEIEVEGIIDGIKHERDKEISRIEEINKNLAIEVDRLENV
jgi:hypothetical protein